MDFLPDDEQLALMRTVSDVIAARVPPLRELATATWSTRDLLAECASLGWFGLGVDVADGGSGATVVEEALVFRELGRALTPGPLLSTLLGARVAIAAGATDLAGSILNGERLVALAEPTGPEPLGPEPLGPEPAAPGSTASPVVTTTHRLFDYRHADLALTISATEARIVCMPHVTDLACIDELTALGACTLSGTDTLAGTTTATDAANILKLGWVLAAAFCSGIAEATLAMSVEYLKVREQFGRPIGSFQALKHQAADMAVHAELSRSIATYAALAMAEAHANAPLYALSARVLCHRGALANARTNVQHHGAIGVTFEHDAHLYVKRVHVLGHILGGVDDALDALLREPSP
jgi:alkylation response protein AidB-like acyl-CoA dehydrogenase